MSNKKIPAKRGDKWQAPQTFFTYLADFASIFLLSFGMLTAYFSITYWEIPGFICAGFVLASLVLLFILGLRWWVTPLLLGTGLLLLFLLYQTSGEQEQLVDYWISFLNWMAQMAPYDRFFIETGGELFLQLLMVFGITAVVFLLVRYSFSVLLLVLLHVAAYILMLLVKDVDLSGSLLLAVGGMIILLPRAYCRYMAKREGAQNGGDKGKKLYNARGRMQVIAIPISLVIITVSQLLIPGDTSAWKSRRLNLFAEDMAALAGDPFNNAPGYESNFNLGSFGFNQGSNRLGGPANLRDELVLQVDAERAVLLRGTVFDEYTGTSWTSSQRDEDFRYNGFFMDQFQAEAFPQAPVYADEIANRLYDTLTDKMSVKVRYRKNTLTTVFTVGTLESCVINDPVLNREIYFNRLGEMYLHQKLPLYTKLTLESDVWRRWDENFYENFLRLESAAQEMSDDSMAAITARYTALPEALPNQIEALTEQITDGLQTPYEKAHAIERWISENCVYTLTPEIPPEDEDFVAHFLETRRGYCVYYATAMAVMARQAGIPARYVTGFGMENALDEVGIQEGTYSYNAKGTTAHAWAELYFAGIGWVEFDPTRGSTEEGLNWQNEGPEEVVATATPSPTQAPTSTPAAQETLGNQAEEAEEETKEIPLAVVAILIGAILLAFYLAYRILRQRKLCKYRVKRVRAKGTIKQFDYYFTDVLKQLKLLQLVGWPGETLTDFSKRVDLRLVVENFQFTEIARIQMQAQFGEIPPSKEEVETIIAYHRLLETMLMQRLDKLKYFFLRALR